MKTRFFATLLLGATLLVSGAATTLGGVTPAQAQQMPTPAQLDQLRRLPRAQQEQLARQFGIDMRMLEQQQRQGEQEQASQDQEIMFPRGTEFDSAGQPILPEDIERQFRRDDSELKPFGYDIFAGQPRSFTPVSHAPVPANYIIGVGDTISIQLFGRDSQVFEPQVDREGRLVVPMLGSLNVAGLTYAAMQALVEHRASERLIGYTVAVSMGELRSIQVFIVGEAHQPGAYTVSSLSTISQALYVAGGVSDIASLRNIQLMRGGEIAADFDVYDLLMRGDASADRLLQSGDVIFIPPRGQMITVRGEVGRPALYEIKPGETFADALNMAGGARPQAYLSRTQVRRVTGGAHSTKAFDLTSEQALAQPLQDGDVIHLRSGAETNDNSLMLIGAVAHPGYYEYNPGHRINDVLGDVRSDLLETADLGYGLVVRETQPRREIKVLQFDVALAIEGNDAENLYLEPNDQIVIFSRFQTKQEEELRLSNFTRSQEERDRTHRETLLRDYRMAFLEDIVRDLETPESEEAIAERELREERERQSRRQIFGSLDDDEEELSKEDYAEYSRERLLEPLIQRLQRQRTDAGNTPFVYIAGEVNHPGMYPLVENASARQLLAAAGGVTEAAYLERAEITRVNIRNGEAVTDYETVNLLDVVLGNVDPALQGRDRLNVLAIPEWQNTYEVTLRGEVRFPGTYAIRRGEKLNDLIRRAGGFTNHAFIEGAIFTREELREQERRRQLMLAQQLQQEIASNAITGTGNSTQSYTEMRDLLQDLMAVQPVGRLIIDLPRILAGNSSMGDVELKNGDELHVPSRLDSVSIMGEVQMASSYRFDRQLTVRDYINMSGGTKQKADTDRIFVVRANGAIESHRQRRGWFSNSGAVDLSPGDVIVVPLNTTYRENLELWSQITNIIYNSAVAVAAINSI